MSRHRSKYLIYFYCFIFSGIACFSYVKRGDYYHKQSDQFYYLSIADSLRTTGEMKVLVSSERSVPTTATSGAAFLMLPFSNGNLESVYLPLIFIYFILNLLSIYPMQKILLQFELGEDLTFFTLLVYFLNLPTTMFKLWPINEAPSMFLVSWFLYFVLVKRNFIFSLLLSFVAPFFRIHIVLSQLALIFYGFFVKESRKFAAQALALLIASISVFVVYKQLFPFTQKGIGQQLSKSENYRALLENIFASIAHIFVSESFTASLFKNQDLNLSAAIGFILFSVSILGFLRFQKRLRFKVLSLSMILVSTISLVLSLTVISRYFLPAALWMILGLILFMDQLGKRYLKLFVVGICSFNIILLLIFTFTKSTDPLYAELEDLKKLSVMRKALPVIYHDEKFQPHERQIYAYFRLPSETLKRDISDQKFQVLTESPNEIASRFKKCQQERHDEKTVSLFYITCAY